MEPSVWDAKKDRYVQSVGLGCIVRNSVFDLGSVSSNATIVPPLVLRSKRRHCLDLLLEPI